MRRFLQHVLPRGFHKVRYFGLWHPAQRHNAARVRQMLQLQAPPKLDPPLDFVVPPLVPPDAEPTPPIEPSDLSALSGAADLHPHALTAPGHGAMIAASTSASTVGLIARVPAHAKGIPLPSPQLTTRALPTMTPSTARNTPHPVCAQPSRAPQEALTEAPIISLDTARPERKFHNASPAPSPRSSNGASAAALRRENS